MCRVATVVTSLTFNITPADIEAVPNAEAVGEPTGSRRPRPSFCPAIMDTLSLLCPNSSGDVRQQICEQLAAERRSSPAGRHAEPTGVNRLDPEQCPLCNTCVTVRFVTRGILEIRTPEPRRPGLSACLTHPP